MVLLYIFEIVFELRILYELVKEVGINITRDSASVAQRVTDSEIAPVVLSRM
jgi:ketol-acid reductoisomerase